MRLMTRSTWSIVAPSAMWMIMVRMPCYVWLSLYDPAVYGRRSTHRGAAERAERHRERSARLETGLSEAARPFLPTCRVLRASVVNLEQNRREAPLILPRDRVVQAEDVEHRQHRLPS